MISTQGWLDKNYPKEKRSKIREIYLNEISLVGELNLADFIHRDFKILISLSIDETKLTFKNLSKDAKFFKCVKAREYINKKYPMQEERKKVKWLDISGKNLEGELDLSEFIGLKTLDCWNNKLTSLNVSQCCQLKWILCPNNQLIKLTLPTNPTGLEWLWLSDNNFPEQCLSFLTPYINLEFLRLGCNNFIGSLDFISKMGKLKTLDVSDTDINEVNITNLPKSLTNISYSIKERPKCKLFGIVPQLQAYEWKDLHSSFDLELRRNWEELNFDKEEVREWVRVGAEPKDYNFISYLKEVKNLTSREFLNNKENFQELRKSCNTFNWCRKCRKPNTSNNWCQLCAEKEWQIIEVKNLTGREMIEKFIQPIYVPWIGARMFHRISYGKFEIEKDENGKDKILGEGGFAKTYKATLKWSEDEVRKVVLKVLKDSRNITLEFLREIANNRLVSGLFTVHYFGISQDSDGNYIMVMDYMESGNLQQFLQKNKGLSIRYKLEKWESVTMGLRVIHEQNLIHRDLHSKNILFGYNVLWASYLRKFSGFITDLGLCRPVNEINRKNIYGVLPYIAPELLKFLLNPKSYTSAPYSQASDVYSLGIVMYEWFANNYPYYDYGNLNDNELRAKICFENLRPSIDKIPLPQLLKGLIKKCWDADPQKRPTAEKLWKTFWDWNIEIMCEKVRNTEFIRQLRESELVYNHWSQNNSYEINSSNIPTSKTSDTKEIIRLLKQKNQLYLNTNKTSKGNLSN